MSQSTRPLRWQHTLEELEVAVTACLQSLDQYEASLAEILHASDKSSERFDQEALLYYPWQSRMAEVKKEVDAVEELLDEQAQAWAHWQQLYHSWSRSLER